MDKKDILIHKIESNPELASYLYDVLNSLEGYNSHRGLITATEGKDFSDKVDTAFPASFGNSIRELGFQPHYFVWNYNESNIFGAPYNVAVAVLNKLSKLTRKYD